MNNAISKVFENAGPSRLDALAQLGLGEPISRFAVGSAVGAVVTWAVRPSLAFFPDGSPKPWTFFADPGEESTALPWYALAILPGVLFSVFL